MAFKQVLDLDADVTVALGGVNKKTGKKNPTQVEGYYIGVRSVESKKSKSGFSNIYFFQTQEGMIGVWGKTDLDRKMNQVKPGTMTLVKQSGTVPTPNGDMYKFTVAVDTDNTIEVDILSNNTGNAAANDETTPYASDDDEDSLDDEAADEVVHARPTSPAKPATAPDANRQARVQALLSSGKARG